MNKLNQLECELKCKATAGCNSSVIEDLNKEDASLAKLLEEKETEDETKNISDTGC